MGLMDELNTVQFSRVSVRMLVRISGPRSPWLVGPKLEGEARGRQSFPACHFRYFKFRPAR